MRDAFRHVVARVLRRLIAPRATTWAFVSLLVTGLAAGVVATQWNIDSDLTALLPENSEAARTTRQMNRRLGGSASLFTIVDSPDTEANLEFAEKYAERLRELPAVSLAHYHNDKSFFENHLLLYFDSDTLADLRRQLEDRIERKKKEANPLFVSLDSSDESQNDDGSSELFTSLEDKKASFKYADFKEYLVSDDGYAVTIVVRFANRSTDLVGTNQLLDKIERVGRQLEPSSYHPDMKIQFGGGLVDRKSQYSSIVDDIQISGIFTIVGIFLLIALYFRRLRAVFWVLTPLVMGTTWTLAIAFLAFGQLTTISVFIFAILLGLGIDYGIHLLSSFDERRVTADTTLEAVVEAFTETGWATALGAGTTLSTFVIVSFAHSRGLSEFGLVASLGTVLTLTAMLIVLPALILTWDRLVGSPDRPAPPLLFAGGDTRETEPPAGWGGRLLGTNLVVALLLCAGTVALLPSVSFEQNFHRIGELMPIWRSTSSAEPDDSPSSATDEARASARRRARAVRQRATDVRESAAPDSFRPHREQTTVGQKYTTAMNSQMSSVPTVLMFDAADRARRVHNYIENQQRAGNLETIRHVNSIHGFVPASVETQRRRLRQIEKLRNVYHSEDLSVLDPERRRQIEQYTASLEVDQPVTARDMPLWTKRLFRESGPQAKPPAPGEPFAYEYVVFLTNKVQMNVGAKARRFLDEIDQIRTATETEFDLASPASTYVATIDQIRYEGRRLITIAVVLILAVLMAIFGGLRRGLVAGVPLMVGLFWMFGLAPLVGIRFDMFNVIIIPAIVGIGVDDGIHFYARYLELGRGSIWETLRTVGTTIVMTSLTSMVGFGGLALAEYRGVRSIGHLAVLGILATLLATLLVLPGLLALAERYEWTSLLPDERHSDGS